MASFILNGKGNKKGVMAQWLNGIKDQFYKDKLINPLNLCAIAPLCL